MTTSGDLKEKTSIQADSVPPPAPTGRFSRDTRDWIVLAIVAVGTFTALGLLRWSIGAFTWGYLASVFIIMVIFVLFGLGLSLQFGYAGLVNFGHVAFMGIAAYGSAIFVIRARDGLAPAITGATASGFLTTLGLGAILGLLLSIPVVILMGRFAPTVGPRMKVAAALGVGAVVTALVTASYYPLSPAGAIDAVAWIGVVFGIACAAGLGLLLGIPTLRLREDYLAIVTIGAAEIMRSFWVNEEWLTQGTLGIQRLERPLIDFSLSNATWKSLSRSVGVLPADLMLVVVGLILVAFVLTVLLVLARSPWGRVLKAIREDEEVAEALGKNAFWFKLQALMIGGAIGGLAGVLFVWRLTNVLPEHFIPLYTFYAFIIVVLGGIGNHKGAVAGAILLWGIFEIAGNLTSVPGLKNINVAGPPQAIFIGLLLIFVMMFRPQGLLGRKEELIFAK